MNQPTETGENQQNPILKLWRGEYSLFTTYWIFGVLGSWLAKLLFNIAAENSLPAYLSVYAIATLYFVVVWVGTWRAADKADVSDSWGGLWVVAARVATVAAAGWHAKNSLELVGVV